MKQNLTTTFIQLLRTKTIKNKIKNKYSEKNHEKRRKKKTFTLMQLQVKLRREKNFVKYINFFKKTKRIKEERRRRHT